MKCSLALVNLFCAVALLFAFAYRICHPSGRWYNNWTNYTECLNILVSTESDYGHSSANNQSATIRRIVICIIFFCSIVSLLLLLATLLIFCYFKTLSSCRIRVHRNLVLALIIHSALLVILSLPHLFSGNGSPPYHHSSPHSSLSFSPSSNISAAEAAAASSPFSSFSANINATVFGAPSPSVFDDWHVNDYLCKTILTMKLYSTLAVINWMFIEGLLLHSRITVSVFRKDAPFKMYYTIGWGLPLLLVLLWATQMSLEEPASHCWTGYGDSLYIWIIVGPMIVALLINCIFLVNIIRVLLTKLRLTVTIELTQIRKAIKATALLFPLLGISHLLFAINPDDDGQLEDAYMIVNAFFQSSQGIFVAILYCFMDSEVQTVLRTSYERHVRYHRSTTTRRSTCSAASQRKSLAPKLRGTFAGWSRSTSTNRSNLSNASAALPASQIKAPIPNGSTTSPLTSSPGGLLVLELAVNGGSGAVLPAQNLSNGVHPSSNGSLFSNSKSAAITLPLPPLQQCSRPDPNHLQPPTPPKKSRTFQFRQPSNQPSPSSPGLPSPSLSPSLSPTSPANSSSISNSSKPRTCIVYNSSSGTMVRFGNKPRSSSQSAGSNQEKKLKQQQKQKRSSSTQSRKSTSSSIIKSSSQPLKINSGIFSQVVVQ